MTEMTANHISCRVPGEEGHFLINPYGMLYEEVTASSLLKIDLDGNILFNATEYGVNRAGFVIHSAIHAARHDVDCVAHTPYRCWHGGFGDGMRPAADRADHDAFPARRLP